MNIRTEKRKDYEEVFDVIRSAYENEGYANHNEQFLVGRLRYSESFVRELSLVAEIDGEIAGYILMTRIKIINKELQKGALALATIAVLGKYRGKGIGGKLIQKAHQRAKALKFDCVIVVGHEKYYRKFGYERTKKYGIKVSFGQPDERCMVKELTENALEDITGTVEYPKEFYKKGTVTRHVKR